MSRQAKNRLKDILVEIQTQFRSNIDGTTYYNNLLVSNQIDLGYEAIEECNKYPHIYIAAANERNTVPVRRDQFEISDEIEIFGYVKESNDTLTKALELQSDMEQALYTDESLSNKVSAMSLSTGVAAMMGYGVVHLMLVVQSQYLTE